jgi:uncharacterized membrane protein
MLARAKPRDRARPEHLAGHGHGHSHGAPSVDIGRRARIMLAVALAPFVLATVIGIVALWPAAPRQLPAADRDSIAGPAHLVNATIEAASRGACTGPDGSGGSCDRFDARLTSGAAAGTQTRFESVVDPAAPRYRAGDRVRLAATADLSGRPSFYIVDYQRGAPLLWIALAAALVVVIVARWRGLAALGGLVLTYVVIVSFTLPALLDARAPMAVALVTGAALLFPLLYLAHGPSARTTVALLGTLASLGLAGLFGAAAIHAARITGLGSDENATLATLGGRLDLSGLLLAGLIIGSLGLINDMTVTQAAAVWELAQARPDAPARALFAAGMRVGRDHIASAVYTLALAYAGAATPTLLLFTLADRSTADVATTDLVGAEIVRTAAGAVGLAVSVPLTTALAAVLITRRPGVGPAGWAADRDETQPLSFRSRA